MLEFIFSKVIVIAKSRKYYRFSISYYSRLIDSFLLTRYFIRKTYTQYININHISSFIVSNHFLPVFIPVQPCRNENIHTYLTWYAL